MNDLDQFKETYIAECFELLEEMEEKLLGLDPESDEVDLEEINAIFRCAHSIKGGAGAFGFSRLVAFTHILEFLLDALRNNEVQVNEDVVEGLLKSVDVVTKLVSCAQKGVELEDGYETEMMATLKSLSSKAPNAAKIADVKAPAAAAAKKSSVSEMGFYQIKFIPFKSLFASGNEPLFIIRELKKLGSVKVIPDIGKIPPVSECEADECYIAWDIEVETDRGIEPIQAAFEFVDGECKLSIEEFAAISMPMEKKDLSEEDEFGGVFVDALKQVEQKSAKDKLAEEDEFGGVFMDSLESIQSAAPLVSVAASSVEQIKKPEAKAPAKAAAPGDDEKGGVSSIRVDIQKIDNMVNMVGEIVITQAMLIQQIKDLPVEQFQGLIQGINELSRHTRELQEAVMAVRMQPVKTVFSRLPRIVRDLSRKLGKQIKLEMKGENTEIDKTVIEQLSDPLTHMIRNSIDHGIEKPEDRVAKGKFAEGTILLSADNTGGRILIEISDDGNGISRERVLRKAVEKGLVAADANLSNEEIDNIIFMAGFSTAEQVTDVSGRGVGMDVVRRNIADLGGEIEMINRPGEGTTFYVSLPLTLAILDGMVVGVGDEKYIIPINNIIETMSLKSADINHVANGDDVINVRGEFVPISYLSRIFNVTNPTAKSDKTLVVLVESGREKMGVVVDEVIGQQQVVIKNLEENADPVQGISGATILGDGNVSLILDVAKINKMRIQEITSSKAAA
jgi:two-component system chemotaxis sensor kinase CheA